MQPRRFGPYTLVHHLATGGMGELYLAQRVGVAGFSKQVVVKCLRDDLANDDEFVEMFLDEGRLAEVLDHPNIVHIYELDEVDDVYFMAMEYVHGIDLGSLLGALGGPLELPAALQVLRDVGAGLSFAHDAVDASLRPLQLVHRDINPANVLVSQSGAVKIADFGIAKVAQRHRQTRAGILKGKFGYLSPEQARGQRVDRRCDIYALGLLLFEMTTGRSALPEGTEGQMLEAAAHGMLSQPNEVRPDYPRALGDIYRRCTSYRPDDRYQTVPELLEELGEFQLDQRLLVSPQRLAELVGVHFGAQLDAQRRVLTPPAAAAAPPGSQSDARRAPAVGSGFEEEPPTETLPRPPDPLQAQPTTADPLDLADGWALEGEDEDVDTMVQRLRGESETAEATQVLVDGGPVAPTATEELGAPLSYSATEMIHEHALAPQDTNEEATVARHQLTPAAGLADKRTELGRRHPRAEAKATLPDRTAPMQLVDDLDDLDDEGNDEGNGDEELMYARTALFDSGVNAAPADTGHRTGPPRRAQIEALAEDAAPAAPNSLATVHLPPRDSVPEDRPDVRRAPTPKARAGQAAPQARAGQAAPPRGARGGFPRWLLFVLGSLLILAAAGAAGYYTRLVRQEREQRRIVKPPSSAPASRHETPPIPPPPPPAGERRE